MNKSTENTSQAINSLDLKTEKLIPEEVLTELRRCKTRLEVDNFFRLRGIGESELDLRSFYLKAATGEIACYYSGGDSGLSDEDLYHDDVTVFLKGSWRNFSSN